MKDKTICGPENKIVIGKTHKLAYVNNDSRRKASKRENNKKHWNKQRIR